MGKIISKEDFIKIRPALAGKKIVMCHGVFDLVHPGHIIHLQQAKSIGDILVVSITSAPYVRKGPGRPYFNDQMRMKFLSALECIDYVMLSEDYTADDVIKVIQPNLYVKGQEYAKSENDITGKIDEEAELVRHYGGTVYYTSGQVFSSTKLINEAFPVFTDTVRNYMKELKKSYSIDYIRDIMEKASELNVLVIGDIIIDRYIYCKVQGTMSKDIGYSVRAERKEEYLGGTLAIARHISTVTPKVTVASVMGNEENIKRHIREKLHEKINLHIETSNKIPTIIKEKFISSENKAGEMQKLFAVNNVPESLPENTQALSKLKSWIMNNITKYNLVLLCDFGHGLVDRELMDIAQKQSEFLSVNCQTNSSNFGANLITKYNKTDLFALDLKELKLAYPEEEQDEKKLIKLAQHLHAQGGWLTRGADGAVGIANGKVLENCPALTQQVKDTIGSGDAFFSIASLFVAAGGSIEAGNFMGNVAAALASNITGNKKSVEKVNILKYASTLLNV